MAQLIAKTDFDHFVGATNSFTVTLSHTVTAGSKLVLLVGGGAICNVSGWVKRSTYGNGNEDVSISDFTAAGGETTVTIGMNGSVGDNVSGSILEFGPGLTFVDWSNNGSGTVSGADNDFQIAPNSGVSLGANTHGVVMSIHTAETTTAFSAVNSLRNYGPLGKLISVGGNVSGISTQFVWGVGLADVTNTQSYPATNAAGHFQATTVYTPGSIRNFAVQALYADTSGVTTVTLPTTKTAQENSLPGTAYQNWFAGDNGTDSTIASYTDKSSYNPGDTVNFQCDSSNETFRVEIYRLGFYGYEIFGARNVTGNQAGYIAGTPAIQATPTQDTTLGSTSCAWTTTASWTIPSGAQSGIYYYLVRRTDVSGHIASGHFTVKASSMTGKMVCVVPDFTYQAYNRWGATTDTGTTMSGRSLYAIGADGGTWNFQHRAYAVSFDRPYGLQADRDVTYLFDSTMSFIAFAEAQGYEICYVSDTDLHANSTSYLSSAAMVVLLGHAEYWTTGLYDSITAVVNTYGINVVNLSSNTALWHTRFDSGDISFRTMICYKDSGTQDVGANTSLPGSGFDPVTYTGTWRDTRTTPGAVNNTDIRRENFLGQIFAVSGHFSGQAVIDFAHKSSPIWRNSADVQALTSGGYTCPITSIGDESDTPDGSAGQPSNMVELFTQTGVTSALGANAAGTVYTSSVSITIAWTLAQTTANALIFSTGNWRGHNPISRWRTASTAPSTGAVDLNFQNAFLSVFYDMGQTPVTLTSMQPGLDTNVTDPAIGAPSPGLHSVGIAYGLSEIVTQNGAAALAPVSTMTSGATRVPQGAVALASTVALTPAQPSDTTLASTTLAPTASLSTQVIGVLAGATALAPLAALTSAGTFVAQAVVSLTPATSLTAGGGTQFLSAATLTMAAGLSLAATHTPLGAADLVSLAGLSVTASHTPLGVVTLNGVTTLAAGAVSTSFLTVSFVAATGLLASLGRSAQASVALSGTSTLLSQAAFTGFPAAALTGVVGLVTGTGRTVTATVNLIRPITTLVVGGVATAVSHATLAPILSFGAIVPAGPPASVFTMLVGFTGNADVLIGPIRTAPQPNPYYLRQRQDWAIVQERQRHAEALYWVGEPVVFMLMWHEVDFQRGLVSRCLTCFSTGNAINDRITAIYAQPTRNKCPDCFGTTFEGGFRARIVRPAILTDTDETEKIDKHGAMHPFSLNVETTWDFRSRAGDYLLRSDGTRFRLSDPQRTTLRTGYQHPSQPMTAITYGNIRGSYEEESTVAYTLPPTSTSDLVSVLQQPAYWPPDYSSFEIIRASLIPNALED